MLKLIKTSSKNFRMKPRGCPLGFFIFLFLLNFSSAVKAQSRMLLLDNTVQLQSTDAVNYMYNFKFDRAEKEFKELKKMYSTHPLPYFLLGLNEWWKIVPNISNKAYDDKFIAYMDTAIYWSEKLFELNEDDIEAAFFLAAAYGFKGRLFSERSEWTKAAFAGKNSLKYLDKSKNGNDLSPEFLFGDALYNYYSIWIPENYPVLKPILYFFPKGDKQLGLKQLKEVANNAFYTRTEAQNFLMNIYSISENNNLEAYHISKYLAETFPDNSYFQRFYARMLYYMGNYKETEAVSLDILNKIERKMPGYEGTSGRYAAFYLGQVYESLRNPGKAKEYYVKAIEYSKEVDALTSGYYLYSLTNLAQLCLAEKNKEEAKKYYQEVLEHAEKDHPTYDEAKNYIKKRKKQERKENRKKWIFFD
ncbi:MAG TPA: tetratricopeptide repeat protein [Cytophagales bacterium]|nr:tetratricopeptide repeat protein [Cytophagales bacterium]